jgi:dTDP-4-amino-4,6-dideoxygalactose transaminase
MLYFANPKSEYIFLKKKIDKKIIKVLNSNSYILGNEVKTFEKNFSNYLGIKYSIGVSSGTDALILSLKSLNIKAGDEIITTSHTAYATIAAIVEVGGIPKFIDIKENDFTMDVSKVTSMINKKTRGIIAVHIYGNPVDIEDLVKISKKNKIFLIEDCSQAHGAEYKNKKVGTFGNVACFSLYPTKNLGGFGDGGIISTNDKSIYRKIKLLREYGWKEKNKAIIHGINNRLDEIQAGILNVKIKFLDKFNKKRKIIAKKYLKEIKSKHLLLPEINKNKKSVYHLFVVRINKNLRSKFINYLKTKNITCGIHYPIPNHAQKPYLKFKSNLLITEKISKEIISLPIYPMLKSNEINSIIKSINNFK